MNRARIVALGVLLVFLLGSTTLAGSSAHYAVDWQVLSGGGALAASGAGAASLNGSLGQTAIGLSSSAGDYDLSAGYWYGTVKGEHRLYLPLVVKD